MKTNLQSSFNTEGSNFNTNRPLKMNKNNQIPQNIEINNLNQVNKLQGQELKENEISVIIPNTSKDFINKVTNSINNNNTINIENQVQYSINPLDNQVRENIKFFNSTKISNKFFEENKVFEEIKVINEIRTPRVNSYDLTRKDNIFDNENK